VSASVLGGGLALFLNIFLIGGDHAGVNAGEALALGSLGLVTFKRFAQTFYTFYRQRRLREARASLRAELDHMTTRGALLSGKDEEIGGTRSERIDERVEGLAQELESIELTLQDLSPLEREISLERKFRQLDTILSETPREKEFGRQELAKTRHLWRRGAIDQETAEGYIAEITRRYVGLSGEAKSENNPA